MCRPPSTLTGFATDGTSPPKSPSSFTTWDLPALAGHPAGLPQLTDDMLPRAPVSLHRGLPSAPMIQGARNSHHGPTDPLGQGITANL
jgi:hypothetical protein